MDYYELLINQLDYFSNHFHTTTNNNITTSTTTYSFADLLVDNYHHLLSSRIDSSKVMDIDIINCILQLYDLCNNKSTFFDYFIEK